MPCHQRQLEWSAGLALRARPALRVGWGARRRRAVRAPRVPPGRLSRHHPSGLIGGTRASRSTRPTGWVRCTPS